MARGRAGVLLDVDRSGDPALVELALELLSGAAPELWRNLDLTVRSAWYGVRPWAAGARDRVATGRAGPVALVLASFHPDGFVREAAVTRLARSSAPIALPALTLRTVDWVPQVRDRARAALDAAAGSAESVLGAGPIASLLAARTHGGWAVGRVAGWIRELDGTELRRVLATPDRRLCRQAHGVALDADRLDRSVLLGAALHDRDVVIRVQCARAAVREAIGARRLDDIGPLLGSGTAAVRLEAVSALVGAGRLDVAVAALGDRNPLVRATAQQALRRTGEDPASRYRARLSSSGAAGPGVIAGLGETGTAADSALIAPRLQDQRPRVRAETVRALRRLGAVDVRALTEVLDDASPSVTRQVVAALLPRARVFDRERLTTLLEARQPRHVRSAAWRLLRARDVWTRLLTDLELLDDLDDGLRTSAADDLATWLTRDAASSDVRTTAETAARLGPLLRRAAGTLGDDRVRLLRFHLGVVDERA